MLEQVNMGLAVGKNIRFETVRPAPADGAGK